MGYALCRRYSAVIGESERIAREAEAMKVFAGGLWA